MKERLRVLISANYCCPGSGSEPGVGWNWITQIQKYHDVWVLTEASNRQAIEASLGDRPLLKERFIYYKLPCDIFLFHWGRCGWYLWYYFWQRGAYRTARRIHEQQPFDLVHHVTLVNYWMPIRISRIPVPFIWGPVGGGETFPVKFLRGFSLKGIIYEILRYLARVWGEHTPSARFTARNSRIAIAATQQTKNRIISLGRKNVEVFSQVGLTLDEIRKIRGTHHTRPHPFRMVCIGNFISWKGFHLGLMAFARFHSYNPESELWFIGDGAEERKLRRLAGKLGVTENVVFWGRIERSEVFSKVSECDALLHPSLHDSGGFVCLEAMAAGLPVICLDSGGPATIVTEECGFRLPVDSPGQVIDGVLQAILFLAQNEDIRKKMGDAAQRQVYEYFNWDKKGEWMNGIYQKVMYQCIH